MRNTTYIFLITILALGCNKDTETSDAYGNFEAETVLISAESSGKIMELNVENGQEIEAGFVAAVIDTVQLHLQLLQIEAQKVAVESRRSSIQAQIEVLEEQKRTLKVDENRTQKMLKDGAATQKQLDNIQGQINVFDKQIASTKTQFIAVNKELEVLDTQKISLKDQLERCSVKSAISGTILETYVEQGELTAPGKSLFKIADLSELELKVYVSGAQLPHIKIGQKVEVIIDKTETKNQTLSGEITWISSEAEFTPKIIQTKEERVKLVYAVKVAVNNDGTLKIGMPGEISWQSKSLSQSQ